MNTHTPPQKLSTDELVRLIERLRTEYYSGNQSKPDSYYDALEAELTRRDSTHPLLNTIGSEQSGAVEGEDEQDDKATDTKPSSKVAHILYMHSQDKVTTEDELRAWMDKNTVYQCVAQYKLDGVSMELQYLNGELQTAVSRGDGAYGDDVTDNILKIQPFPQQIANHFTGAVRGELIMRNKVHAKHFPDLANARNTTAGLIKRKDGVGCEHIELLCYDARFSSDSRNKISALFSSHEQIQEWLDTQGFDVAPWQLCHGPDEVLARYNAIAEQRRSLPYEIDGIIVKSQMVYIEDQLRTKPKYQVAFKFAIQTYNTTLRAVEWNQAGRYYTPVAIIDPTVIAGTTVRRASLVNPRLIIELGIRIGSTVAISKRGEIIPKIERLVEQHPSDKSIPIPSHCTACGTMLTNQFTRLYCDNPRCPVRIRHKIRKWIETLGVKEFGEILIKQLYDSGAVTSIADLYTIDVNDIASLERQGELSAKNALDNLRAVTSLSLSKFIAGNDFDNIGELTMQTVIDAGYNTLDALAAATSEHLECINGIGMVMARQIVQVFSEHIQEMRNILQVSGITITAADAVDGVGALSGSSFCFSGALQEMGRKQAQTLVLKHGGIVKNSVTRSLTYLVTNDPNSTNQKVVQAQQQGCTILSEEQFLQMVGQ